MQLRSLILAAVAAAAFAPLSRADELFKGTIEVEQGRPADGDVNCFARFLVVDRVRHPLRGPLAYVLELDAGQARGQEVRLKADRAEGQVLVPTAILAVVAVDVEGDEARWAHLGVTSPWYQSWVDLLAEPDLDARKAGRVFAGERVEVVAVERVSGGMRLARVRTADGRAGWLDPMRLHVGRPTRARAKVVDGRLEVEGGLFATGRPARDLAALGPRDAVILEGHRVGQNELVVERVLIRLGRAAPIKRSALDQQDAVAPAGAVVGFYGVSKDSAIVVHLGPEASSSPGLVGTTPRASLDPAPGTKGLIDLPR